MAITSVRAFLVQGVLLGAASATVWSQPLPPPPVPPENPITEPKRVLGKILFWDEQLSSDDTVACGTCHRPAAGGADARMARHPGADETLFTDDDVFGSQGVVRRNADGVPVADPIFGFSPQVTRRSAPSFFGSQDASTVFWDGRAGVEFRDPETGSVVIEHIGALESQAIEPILSDVEMAREGRTWDDVRDKLISVLPLALATNLPPDVSAAIAAAPSYPDLFAAAFGDPSIGAARIAMAVATYERTLVPNQTPFDLGAVTPAQQVGFQSFGAESDCIICHEPPHFSAFGFANLGVRPIAEDIGRQAVTGALEDRGAFKIATLRNVGLRPRFFHNGRRMDLQAVLDFYASAEEHFGDNVDPILPVEVSNHPEVIDFLTNALTDPRVASETFPFDRPTLASELAVDVAQTGAGHGVAPHARATPNPFTGVTTLWYVTRVPELLRLTIFDVRGRVVAHLLDEPSPPGRHGVRWDGRDDHGRAVRSGVYFFRLKSGAEASGGRLVLRR